MTYDELKHACELAGLTGADQIWFIDLHPTPEHALVELTKHDTLGYAVTNVPVLLPALVMQDTVPHPAGGGTSFHFEPPVHFGSDIATVDRPVADPPPPPDAPLHPPGAQVGSTVPVSTPVADPPKAPAASPAAPKTPPGAAPDKGKLPKA